MSAKHAKVLAKLVESGGGITKAGKGQYSDAYLKSGKLQKTKAWEELVEDMLSDTVLAKVHKEGLEATKIHTSHTEPDMELPDYAVRHKYLDTAYKVKKRYDNTINVKGALAVLSDEELEGEIAGLLSEALIAIAGEKETPGE